MTTPIEFKECDDCAKEPGVPVLCAGCLHNRDAIAMLTAAKSVLPKVAQKETLVSNAVAALVIEHKLTCPGEDGIGVYCSMCWGRLNSDRPAEKPVTGHRSGCVVQTMKDAML